MITRARNRYKTRSGPRPGPPSTHLAATSDRADQGRHHRLNPCLGITRAVPPLSAERGAQVSGRQDPDPHSCIERSALPTCSTRSPRSHARGLQMSGLLGFPGGLGGGASLLGACEDALHLNATEQSPLGDRNGLLPGLTATVYSSETVSAADTRPRHPHPRLGRRLPLRTHQVRHAL